MDPISLIVAALVAGASKAGLDMVDQASKDAYDRLKSLILRRFGGDPERRRILEEFEEDPAGPTDALALALSESGLPRDPEALKIAHGLLARADPQSAARGTYTVHVGGNAQGIVVGDQNRVTFQGPSAGEP